MAKNLDRPLATRARRRGSFKRGLYRLALVVGIVGLAVFLVSRVDLRRDMSRMHLSVLSGEKDGNYYALVARWADVAATQRGSITNLPSAGSAENVRRLVAAAKSCELQVALAQDGSDWSGADGAPAASLELLARLPRSETVFFLAKGGEHITELGALRGKRVGVGPAGGGTERVARQLFALPELAAIGAVLSNHPLDEELDLAVKGDLDVAMLVIREDAPLVVDAVTKRGLGVIGFSHADAVAQRLTHLRPGVLAAGEYDAVGVIPPTDAKVMRVDTLVVANGCAGRAATVDLLTVLAKAFPDLVVTNRGAPNATGLPVAATAQEFYETGGPELADQYLPWLVDVMPPPNWAYVVMGVSILFNTMGFGHRFRLWRIDAARVKLEGDIAHFFTPTTTLGDIARTTPDAELLKPEKREGVATVVRELEELAARSRRYSLSMLVPMGQEMAYRYQEEIIYETIAVLRDFVRRCDEVTTKGA
jgi:TRAP-type uncharacterized transport system substrate-binding protein